MKKKRPVDASLKPDLNSKIRQEYLDYDYLEKLSEEEYLWLAAFTNEDNCANLHHSLDKVLKRNKQVRSEVYNKNNYRNRDSFGVTKAHRRLIYLETGNIEFMDDCDVEHRSPEDAMIELIDTKNSQHKMEQLEIEHRRAAREMKKIRSNGKKKKSRKQ